MIVGLFPRKWSVVRRKTLAFFFLLHWIQLLHKLDPWTSSKDVLSGEEDGGDGNVFSLKNVLVDISLNHRYYSGDWNSSSRIKEQEETLFFQHWQGHGWLFFSSIPSCLKRSDKKHKCLRRSNLSLLRDSNCLMEWLISCFFLTPWCGVAMG